MVDSNNIEVIRENIRELAARPSGKDYDEEIEKINEDINALSGEVVDLETDVSEIEEEISAINTNLSQKVSFYTADSNNIGIPSTDSGYYKIQKCETNANEYTEIAIGYFGTNAIGKVFSRSCVSGTVSSWVSLDSTPTFANITIASGITFLDTNYLRCTKSGKMATLNLNIANVSTSWDIWGSKTVGTIPSGYIPKRSEQYFCQTSQSRGIYFRLDTNGNIVAQLVSPTFTGELGYGTVNITYEIK